jgi:hypothetical protein
MPLVPPITPTNPGGDRQFQTAWEDLLRVLNRAHRNRIVVAVPLANPVPQGYGQVDRYAVDSIGGNAPDYVLGRTNCTALSTSALSTNTLRAVPFRVEEPRRITSVAFRVTVAGGAGSKGRMAIYDSKGDESEGNWYPNQKVWQGTEFNTNASTGTKATSTTLDLKPGRRYWAVYWCGTSAPTVNAVPVAANGCDLASAAGTGTTYLSVALTYTSTGFPQTFPSGAIGVSTVAPALMLTMTRPDVVDVHPEPDRVGGTRGWCLRSSRGQGGQGDGDAAGALGSGVRSDRGYGHLGVQSGRARVV